MTIPLEKLASGVLRIGIDAGGTFTDFFALLPDGATLHHKEPSDRGDPSRPIQAGLEKILAREDVAAQTSGLLLAHGTTIGLNAVLQGKGANVALVVTSGMRDVLEVERGRLPNHLSLHATKPAPIVSRDKVLEIGARANAKGEVVARPEAADYDALCEKLGRLQPEAVAVVLINSYLVPSLEHEVADAIRARLPDTLVTCSSDIWPELREFERSVIACLNAKIHPLMESYLHALKTRLDGLSDDATLQLTTSAGGMLDLDTALARPIETMMSGPASGTVAAARLAADIGITAAVTFDMGGTSADIAILSEGRFEFTNESRVGQFPLIMPVVGVSSIGAGGGSILHLDSAGLLKVGPESAGSQPGPVAFGLGGTEPTVTDCFIALGIIDPGNFLGGRMRIDRDGAIAALERLAPRLGLSSAEDVAEAALAIATTGMSTELLKLLARAGFNPDDHLVMPFGGAGPTHAVMLAEDAGLPGVVIPAAAATFCALGAVMADARRDFLRSIGQTGWNELGNAAARAWQSMLEEARQWLAQQGGAKNGTERFAYQIDMRYAGQAHNIVVDIDADVATSGSAKGIAAAFHKAHQGLYGFAEADEKVEAVSVRLSLTVPVPAVELPRIAPHGAEIAAHARKVFHNGSWRDASVFWRPDLGAGFTAIGPAVVEQSDTTTWVPPGWFLRVHETGALIVTRSGADEA